VIIKKLKGPNNRAVNLHHPTLRNCVMTFTMFTRKYPSPYPCPTCKIDHEYKTVHLNLNNDGDVALNEPLYQKLKDQGLLGELKATHETVPLPTGVNIFGFFDDNADVTPDDSHVYQSAYTAGETPAFSTRVAHTNVTFGVLATGVVNADDHLFTTGEVLPAGDPVESYIIYRYLTSAAASPLLAHYGTATGLPLTPNGADVTVVYNASGMWTY
jgi:hypothetical protein